RGHLSRARAHVASRGRRWYRPRQQEKGTLAASERILKELCVFEVPYGDLSAALRKAFPFFPAADDDAHLCATLEQLCNNCCAHMSRSTCDGKHSISFMARAGARPALALCVAGPASLTATCRPRRGSGPCAPRWER